VILLLTSFAVSVLSALVPVVNIEVYLAGVGATGAGSTLSLTLAAGIGQSLGKVIWYEGARRGVDSTWMQKRLSGPKISAAHQRWLIRMEGRPWYAAAVLFAAASVGVPPMLVMAAVAGALKVPRVVFIPTVLVGRTLRFGVLLGGIGLAFG
jgi:membrane protein YqaA with SNARE-associated domain